MVLIECHPNADECRSESGFGTSRDRPPRTASGDRLMSENSLKRIAGSLLVLVACGVVGLAAWQQELEITRTRGISAERGEPEQLSREARGFYSRPSLLLPMAGLLLLGGCFMLLRNNGGGNSRTEDRSDGPLTKNGQGSGLTAGLLAQQRSLGRAERVAVATEFAASMSHEIRNPLAGIQMSLSNLIAESADRDLKERMQTISSETVRVTELLGKAVGAARQTPESFQEVDLEELVTDLLELLHYQMPGDLEIEYEVEEKLRRKLPVDRFRHCLANLLLNSIRAVEEEEGWIRLQIESQAENLRLVVSDNGPGFPQEVLSGGTRPFDTREADGGGIGLAMVRRFVREMGGQIQLVNETRHDSSSGGRVTILLPFGAHHG